MAEVLERKTKGRQEIAGLSFGAKIEMMEALRSRLAPFKALRDMRQQRTACGADLKDERMDWLKRFEQAAAQKDIISVVYRSPSDASEVRRDGRARDIVKRDGATFAYLVEVTTGEGWMINVGDVLDVLSPVFYR